MKLKLTTSILLCKIRKILHNKIEVVKSERFYIISHFTIIVLYMLSSLSFSSSFGSESDRSSFAPDINQLALFISDVVSNSPMFQSSITFDRS